MVNNRSENNNNAVSVCGGQFSAQPSSQPKYYLVAPQSPLRQQNIQLAIVPKWAERDVDTVATSECGADEENIDNINSVDVNRNNISCDDIHNKNSAAQSAETDVEKTKTKKIRRRVKLRKRYRR